MSTVCAPAGGPELRSPAPPRVHVLGFSPTIPSSLMIDISFPLEPALFNCPRSPSLACTAACARRARPRLPLSYSRRRRRCVVCCCSFLLGCVLAYLPHSRHDRYHLYHHVDVASDCRCRPSSRSRCISTLVVISQRCGAVRVCARAAMIEISSGLCACACAPMSASTSACLWLQSTRYAPAGQRCFVQTRSFPCAV